jgi:hypothetical protein
MVTDIKKSPHKAGSIRFRFSDSVQWSLAGKYQGFRHRNRDFLKLGLLDWREKKLGINNPLVQLNRWEVADPAIDVARFQQLVDKLKGHFPWLQHRSITAGLPQAEQRLSGQARVQERLRSGIVNRQNESVHRPNHVMRNREKTPAVR